MPTASETVPNRPLSGSEYREILRQDFEKLLDGEGLLSTYMGFGRVAHKITLQLFMANPLHPESKIYIDSRQKSKQEVEAHPELAAIEAPPLTGDEVIVSEHTASRDITSPNSERLRSGQPVPVEVRQADGTVITQDIKYPKSDDDGGVTIEDTSPRRASAAPTPSPELSELGKCGHKKVNVALSGICSLCGEEWQPASAPERVEGDPGAWPKTKAEKVADFFK